MAIVNDIRAIEAAKMRRTGASLSEIAKFWNQENPLSRQRVSQLVGKGERLLARRDNPVYLTTINKDESITEEIALRLGISCRVAALLGKLNLTARELDHMLNSMRHVIINYQGMGVKSFNELADLFGRRRWENKYLGKDKYQNAEQVTRAT